MDLALSVIVGLVLLGIAVWFARYVRSVRRGDYRHSSKGSVWFVPGQGTHGSAGGQTPPIVPKNEDWDPDRRIK